jgi:hypothetical protein
MFRACFTCCYTDTYLGIAPMFASCTCKVSVIRVLRSSRTPAGLTATPNATPQQQSITSDAMTLERHRRSEANSDGRVHLQSSVSCPLTRRGADSTPRAPRAYDATPSVTTISQAYLGRVSTPTALPLHFDIHS